MTFANLTKCVTDLLNQYCRLIRTWKWFGWIKCNNAIVQLNFTNICIIQTILADSNHLQTSVYVTVSANGRPENLKIMVYSE